jgi:glycerol-3-phosphate acyltransferase PlsY
MKNLSPLFDSLLTEMPLFLVIQLSLILSYLLGSISFSVLFAHMMRLPDPRFSGSGNAGATNMLRTGSRLAAFLTLMGDLFKGVLPVFLVCRYKPDPLVIDAAMLGVFFGHLYPIYFEFKGGKGVATTIGILIGLHWPLGLSMAGLWLVTLAVTRISSLAALLTAAVSPIVTYFWLGKASAIPITVIAVFQFWKHRSNIQRLLSHNEPKVGVG